MMNRYIVAGTILLLVGCSSNSTGPLVLPPQTLTYRLEPSGDPLEPAALILEWTAVNDPNLAVYNVYSRVASGDVFDLRGSTTSLSFHDVGQPDLEYYVVSVNLNGVEGEPSAAVVIDERLRLESPSFLQSTTLDGAVHLLWGDNPFQSTPEGFRAYRVYSTDYFIDTNECGGTWGLEGTTVAPEFLVAELPNAKGFCFAVSAESIEGWESMWSDVVADTPRPDARNVVMYRMGADVTASGFRFDDGVQLGIVTTGTGSSIDFRIVAGTGGALMIEPIRSGVGVLRYTTGTVGDLTEIDFAPQSGYSTAPLVIEPGAGYVFEMPGGDGFLRFGAVRAAHVGADFIVFDWSYQLDPGNPELRRHGGKATYEGRSLVVVGVR